MSQEDRSIFWKVTVFTILSKRIVLFQTVSEVKLFHQVEVHCTLYIVHCTLYRRATGKTLTRYAKCPDAANGIFENELY
jgi:hypothetical protein